MIAVIMIDSCPFVQEMSGQLQEARTAAEAAKASLSAEKIGAQQRIASLEKQRAELEVGLSFTQQMAFPNPHVLDLSLHSIC